MRMAIGSGSHCGQAARSARWPTRLTSLALVPIKYTRFRRSARTGNARSRLERLLGRKVAVTGTLTQWHTGSQRAAVVSGNFATTLKLADKERHRVAGQSDQDHHHGPAEARRFGANPCKVHLQHLSACSSTFRRRMG